MPYRLPEGLLADADPSRLNLAAPLADGSLLVIPSLSDPEDPASIQSEPASAPVTRSGAVLESGLLDINLATAADFENLPEIGPVIAQRIVDYREANGPFTTLEAIQNVAGIGPVTFEQIKSLITVSTAP